MKIRECVKYGADVLKNAGLEEYRFESEYLLAECLGIERITVSVSLIKLRKKNF